MPLNTKTELGTCVAQEQASGPGQKTVKEAFDLWTDGSAGTNGAAMGAGWVVCNQEGEAYEYASPVLSPRHGSSDIAEIKAATLAMKAIPAAAEVTIHTDSMNLIRYYQDHALSPLKANASKKKQRLHQALGDLFEAAKEHEAVHFEKSWEEENPHAKRAHHLSREGASQAQKTRRDPKAEIFSSWRREI